jgi:hypothetical protein
MKTFCKIEHSKAGEYDEQVVFRIDKLLGSASRYGIRDLTLSRMFPKQGFIVLQIAKTYGKWWSPAN